MVSLTYFTIWPTEINWAVTCESASSQIWSAFTTISARIGNTWITSFTIATSVSEWTVARVCVKTVWTASATVQTWIWFTDSSYIGAEIRGFQLIFDLFSVETTH